MDTRYTGQLYSSFFLIINFMRYSTLVSTATPLLPELHPLNLKRSNESTGLLCISENSEWVSSTASPINSPVSLRNCNRIALSPDEQSVKFRWDEYEAGNPVKDKIQPTSSKQDEKCWKCYKMLTGTEGKRERDRNQMRPDERKNKLKIYWRQQKMQETRSEWQGGEWGTYRDTSVFI